MRSRRILWTYHVNTRLGKRFLTRETILDSVDSYEIFEQYPEDKYLPSYLVLAGTANEPLHILFAPDVASENVRIITAYRPSPQEWENDCKTRKASR
ncbi:MAG: DUF4258 domain-containing protein [Acidimicrobiia bacterium]|nr:DUF4258 domain-containing protein [Acidimicrobiia bacterium]